MREHHPDVSQPGSRIDPSLVTEAYSIVLNELRSSPTATVADWIEQLQPAQESFRLDATVFAEHDGDTIWIEAPPDEAYQRLLDAAASIGGIGHVDRTLGLLEVIVRFEGGPSCSFLMTLQGRAHGTDVFCEMESIEASPTPSIVPVLDALIENLQTSA